MGTFVRLLASSPRLAGKPYLGLIWTESWTSPENAFSQQLCQTSLLIAGLGVGGENAYWPSSLWTRLMLHWNMKMRRRRIDAFSDCHHRFAARRTVLDCVIGLIIGSIV
jgi:hypothetical protein